MARANSADADGIVWDTPDEGIVWDEPQAPKKKGAPLPAFQRFILGARAPIDAGTQLAGKANEWLANKNLVPRLKNNDAAGIEQRRQARIDGAPEGVDWAGMAGELLSPATLALMAVPGGTVLRAGMVGATSGVMQPAKDDENFWNEKGAQAVTGAAGAGVLNVAGRGLSRMLSPNSTRNADLQLLRREGVRPTVGQTLGGGWNRFEEKAQSLPIVGDAIAGARHRARVDFNRAAINRATRPVRVNIDEAGHAGVDRAGRAISHAYDDAGSQMGAFRLDRQGIQELRNLRGMAQRLTPDNAQQFEHIYREQASRMGPRGQMLPDNFKDVDSSLGRHAADFTGSSDAHQRRLGNAVTEFQRVLRDTGRRQNPGAARAYDAADTGYANLVRVEEAAKRAKLQDGTFTPGHLLGAVQQGDNSVRNRAVGRGTALMQDLGTAGQNVLGNKVPDSGTAGRLLSAGASVGGVGGAAGVGLIEPTTAITTAVGVSLGVAAYTQAGQALLRTLVSARPGSPAYHRAAQGLRRLAQSGPAAPIGAQAATSLFEEE